MRFLARCLVKKIVKDDLTTDPTARLRYGAWEGWISVAVNLVFFVLKLLLSLLSGSVALMADAVHTVSDMVTSVVIILAFHLAGRKPNRRHPFGHGQWEAIAALIIAVLLFTVCVDLFNTSIRAVMTPKITLLSWWLIGLIAATILVKEWLAQFAFELGNTLDSQALIADGMHHRSDVLATAMVVVGLVAARFGIARLDGIMGLGVSLVIMQTAWSLFKNAVSPLLGEAPDPELIQQIEQTTLSHPSVRGVHDIIVHQYGQTKLVSLHIEVDADLTAVQAHKIAEKVEEDLADLTDGPVIAHVDPLSKNHPEYSDIEKTIAAIVCAEKLLHSFQDLRITGSSARQCNVICDLVLARPLSHKEQTSLLKMVRSRFKKKYPSCRLTLKTRLRYSFQE